MPDTVYVRNRICWNSNQPFFFTTALCYNCFYTMIIDIMDGSLLRYLVENYAIRAFAMHFILSESFFLHYSSHYDDYN